MVRIGEGIGSGWVRIVDSIVIVHTSLILPCADLCSIGLHE
jgi:hypothetical protein